MYQKKKKLCKQKMMEKSRFFCVPHFLLSLQGFLSCFNLVLQGIILPLPDNSCTSTKTFVPISFPSFFNSKKGQKEGFSLFSLVRKRRGKKFSLLSQTNDSKEKNSSYTLLGQRPFTKVFKEKNHKKGFYSGIG